MQSNLIEKPSKVKMKRFRSIWPDVMLYLRVHTRAELVEYLNAQYHFDVSINTLNKYITRMRAEDKNNPQPVLIAPTQAFQPVAQITEKGEVIKQDVPVKSVPTEKDPEELDAPLTEDEYNELVIKRKKNPTSADIHEVIKIRVYEAEKKEADEAQFLIDQQQRREKRHENK